MTKSSMKGFRCWSAESVGQTVFSDIGALASDADAIFLAAHTPVELDHGKGAELGDRSTGEAQVLDALIARVGDLHRNTLVAVTGGSGSGKSHVVRWVHAHIDRTDKRFRVMYVPRAVQTIRELLRRIIEGLPGVEGSELMARVDEAISGSTPGEMQDRLVAEMRIALNWSLEDRAPYEGETDEEAAAREDRNNLLGERDSERRRHNGLADLLELPAINQTLLRSDGHLSQLVQSYFSETSRRDDNDEIFTRDDLPIRERGILGALKGRDELRELWQIIQRQPDDALALLEEALRMALPKALGLRLPGADTLDALFRSSRKALRDQKLELILIFEDLAQFGLIDGELYDQFVTPPGDELAPLRVVFAVTDGAFNKMERTVRTRIEHQFRVGDSALEIPEQFIGRYLNLARVGRETTQSLWKNKGAAEASTKWMANACDTREEGGPCRFKDTCHASFGTVEIPGHGEVGLYPYNAIALRRAVERVGEKATPREVLDECISTVLVEADVHIAAGDFPHPRTKEQFDFKARMAKEPLLERHPSIDPERTYRALVIWGDERSLDPGVLEAFALESGTARQSGARRPLSDTNPTVPVASVGASRRTPVVENVPTPLFALFQWQNGQGLPEDDVNFYRITLHSLTFARLNLDQALAHVHKGRGKQILDSLFNSTSFSIEDARGRRAGSESLLFELTRSSADIRILVAARWFRDHGHFDPTRGGWEWPEGYDPVQLMVELEVCLDGWAAQVRERFLTATGGSDLARRAIGLRALALAAIGHDPFRLESTSAVLESNARPAANPSVIWRVVDDVALRVLGLQTYAYVGEFAAVRQGAGGDPQLVDTWVLDQALAEFFDEPVAALEATAVVKADPVLAHAAQDLLDAISAAASAESDAIAEVSSQVASALEGQLPSVVGQRALEVGAKAKDNGLFRPREVNSWNEFREAVGVLTDSGAGVSVPNPEGAVDGLLRAQYQARRSLGLFQALDVVMRAMAATRDECIRSGSVAGNLSEVRSVVRFQLGELADIVQAMAAKE